MASVRQCRRRPLGDLPDILVRVAAGLPSRLAHGLRRGAEKVDGHPARACGVRRGPSRPHGRFEAAPRCEFPPGRPGPRVSCRRRRPGARLRLRGRGLCRSIPRWEAQQEERSPCASAAGRWFRAEATAAEVFAELRGCPASDSGLGAILTNIVRRPRAAALTVSPVNIFALDRAILGPAPLAAMYPGHRVGNGPRYPPPSPALRVRPRFALIFARPPQLHAWLGRWERSQLPIGSLGMHAAL
mmetsp:Transcript_52425/g.152586  ORF Transcript_52425/g.152586 Transcript_52425/m.152586 type:complete len:243 (-) Transcript_52425:291-1019(-)